MTHEEKKLKVYQVAKKLVKFNGYIKGYGDRLDRVMDSEHRPLDNIPYWVVEIMKSNNLLIQEGLIWKPSKNCSLLKEIKEITIEKKNA